MKKTLVFSVLAYAAAAIAWYAPTAVAGNSTTIQPTCGPNSVIKCPVAVPDDPVAFLCYSRFQTDPGQWGIEQAKELLAAGYWAPIAETTVPTLTRLATGFYLNCQGFSDGDLIVGGDGTVIDGMSWTNGLVGFYPLG